MSKKINIFIVFILLLSLTGSIKTNNSDFIKRDNEILIDYQPESNKVRYKYELSYTPANSDVNDSVKGTKLIELSRNGKIISTLNYSNNYNIVIPETSETISNIGKLQDEFFVNIIESLVSDKIKYKARIIVEEIKNGKWTPVYQAIFMKRGPYYSIDKGPIEKTHDK